MGSTSNEWVGSSSTAFATYNYFENNRKVPWELENDNKQKSITLGRQVKSYGGNSLYVEGARRKLIANLCNFYQRIGVNW